MRLFLALEPTAEARHHLAGAIRDLFSLDPALHQRFRPTVVENVHVTVHFLGEIEEARLARVVGELGDSVAEAAFDIAFGRPSVFPGHGPARGLKLGVVHGGEALQRVHDALGGRLTRADVTLDARPFVPHVTIARARRGNDRTTDRRFRLKPDCVNDVGWRVTQVVLFESDLRGPAPRYSSRHVVRLAGPPG